MLPTPVPSPLPTSRPTPVPTIIPTPEPTAQPTPVPTPVPTFGPTPYPSATPTFAPTPATPKPTQQPTAAPTRVNDVSVIAVNFSATCEGWNASVPRRAGFEGSLDENEVDALSESLAAALPFGLLDLTIVERERLLGVLL